MYCRLKFASKSISVSDENLIEFSAKGQRHLPPRFLPLQHPGKIGRVEYNRERGVPSPPAHFRRGNITFSKPKFGSFSLTTDRYDKQFIDASKIHRNCSCERNRYKSTIGRCSKLYSRNGTCLKARRKSELNFGDDKYQGKEICNICKLPKPRNRRVTFEELENGPKFHQEFEYAKNGRKSRRSSCSR